MYQYITIPQIISIEEYQSYGYSIRKIASKINCLKSNFYKAWIVKLNGTVF